MGSTVYYDNLMNNEIFSCRTNLEKYIYIVCMY